jgi:56kDa selenium binding protein (SBP56)
MLMDHETFDVLGRWEVDRSPQELAYDMWWHLGHDTMVTSEWGTPDMFENGLVPELSLAGKYGHKLHFWDLHRRKHQQEIDLEAQHQLVFELRPAHDPTKAYGCVNCVLSLENLSSSIWTWYRDGNAWKAKKVIEDAKGGVHRDRAAQPILLQQRHKAAQRLWRAGYDRGVAEPCLAAAGREGGLQDRGYTQDLGRLLQLL